jgi:hypothetical protein
MPQDKTLWKNNTAALAEGEGKGFIIGVSVYDQDNKQTRRPLMPGETIWLTEDERILTANAPRNDADNPFENGHLLQVSEEQRPIGRSIGSATTTTGETTAAEPEPAPEAPADPAPEPEAPAAPTPTAPPAGISQLPPELRLGGDDDTEKGEAPAVPGPVSVVPDGEVREVTEEEHAAVADSSVAEETGAAVPPAGEPPIGEYAKDEEVGTPDAAGAVPPPPPLPSPSPDPIDQEQGLHALTPPAEDPPANGPGGKFGK